MENTLYYGDNLDVLRRHIKDETVDLVYLDPPFNSKATYNVLFAEKNGTQAAAQIKAFDDTWQWDQAAAETYQEVVEFGGKVSQAMQAFRQLLGDNDMLAYLAMMAPRLVELRRVLKQTGSIYLHCDSTASHYLKILMDAIFSVGCFRNEIVWKRTSSHGDAQRYGRTHDVVLYYGKGGKPLWRTTYLALDEAYVDTHYRHREPDGRRFMDDNLSGAGPGPPRRFGKRGMIPPPAGRHWKNNQQGIDQLVRDDRIYWTKKGLPRVKIFLDDSKGAPVQDVWADIPPINSQARERLGYPTQKPEALLERIIKASSNEGDIVLDPFCGCGTTIAAAQKLNRRWIGIDITFLAVGLIKHRLKDAFGDKAKYQVIGEPVSLPDAEGLAKDDPYQFQWWALGLVGARPVEQKKGADKGIDGRIYFHDEGAGGKTKQVILSVKAGHTGVKDIRDLRGVVEREKAEIGVLLTMQSPTQPMRTEVAGAGFYDSPGWGKKYPRIQILTIEELLGGASVDMPPLGEVNVTFKKAVRAEEEAPPHPELFSDSDPE